MKTKIILAIAGVVLGFASATATAGPNLVTNGSFENGFAGWDAVNEFFISDVAAHTGMLSAVTGCSGPECVSDAGSGAFIAQTIATAAGSKYDLSFWVAQDGGPPAALSVFWDGGLVALVADPAAPGQDFVQYTFADLIASGASTTFELHGRQDMASIYFDDVVVTGQGGTPPPDPDPNPNPQPVPEPASLALLGLGLAGVAVTRRRLGRQPRA